jgi:WhiB family redox-sensing transcriptional regulator
VDEVTRAIEALEHGTVRAYRSGGCRCEECRAGFARNRYTPPDTAERIALERLEPPGEWMRSARCKAAPVNLFFPERGDDVRPAKLICAGCPVLVECRAYALAAGADLQGVWGGLSAKERRESRRYGNVA